MTIEGLSSPFCYEGTLNTQLFEFWVENFLLPILTPQSVVILDNASIHKNEEVIAMIEETQASVLFLPPYCPELNPIEPIWAKIKSDLKKILISTTDELYQAIAEALDTITSDDARNSFLHSRNPSNKPIFARHPSAFNFDSGKSLTAVSQTICQSIPKYS